MLRDIMLAVTGAMMAAGGLRAQRRVLPVVGLLGSELPGSFGRRRTAKSNQYRPNTCRFYGRCPKGQSNCAAIIPELRAFGVGRSVACHYPEVVVRTGTGDRSVIAVSLRGAASD
jgi:hypothetical protein